MSEDAIARVYDRSDGEHVANLTNERLVHEFAESPMYDVELLEGRTEEKRLATDGGEVGETLYHLPEAPEFEHDTGDTFVDLYDEEAYWVVKKRFWDYDADCEGAAVPDEMMHKVYQIGEVAGLGYPQTLVTEAELEEHYERVPKEEAEEVI